MKTITKGFLATLVSMFFFLNMHAQNQEELFIEQLDEQEAYDIKGGMNCKVGDTFVTIKSDIPTLVFESNVMDIAKVKYDENNHDYLFCHKKGSFILTISSPSHISKDIHIDGKSHKYAFKVVSKLPTGKFFFKTNPNNSYVDFGLAGLSPQLTAAPIEMNAGEYKVRISKIGYLPLDTMVIVPSDGSTKMMDVTLKQDFAKIQLDISTSDMTQFQMYPVIDIDTAHVNMADMFDNNKLRSFDDVGNLEYFKLYKGGYVPVPAGAYNIRINTPGFQTYSTIIRATKGSTSSLVVKLQPIMGYLTLIDNGGAIGAKVFWDETEIGTLPMFRHPVRIGTHKLRIEKPGFLTPEKDYKVIVTEDTEEALPITMTVFKEYYVSSDPAGSEVLVDNQREGFTPTTIYLNEGKHDVIIRRAGYFDDKRTITITNKGYNEPDTIRTKMLVNHPLSIKSEAEGLNIVIKQDNQILSTGTSTPAELQLPFGDYKLELYEGKAKRFSGNFTHDGTKSINAPCYSYGTFTALVGDYFTGDLWGVEDTDNEAKRYKLLSNLQFGRFTLFPGLSTTILRASVFELNKDYKGELISVKNKEKVDINVDSTKYKMYMFSASCMFLNGEFRLGGSVLKNLDVCALGTYVWYPDMTSFAPISHISGTESFIGIEVSSRISYFNVNFKFGKEMYKGKYNFLINKDEETKNVEDIEDIEGDKFFSQPFKADGMVFTVGVTLGRTVSKSNNMLRLWKKPLVSNY